MNYIRYLMNFIKSKWYVIKPALQIFLSKSNPIIKWLSYVTTGASIMVLVFKGVYIIIKRIISNDSSQKYTKEMEVHVQDIKRSMINIFNGIGFYYCSKVNLRMYSAYFFFISTFWALFGEIITKHRKKKVLSEAIIVQGVAWIALGISIAFLERKILNLWFIFIKFQISKK